MVIFVFYITLLLLFVLVAVYVERKVAAFIQHRMGPMEVGPKGLLQTFADLLKMLQKEDIKVLATDKIPFLLAPIIVFIAVFSGYAVLPIHPNIAGVPLSGGLLFLLAMSSFHILGVLMAGWSSNNKYSIYGAMRAVAQTVSYEIPLGMSVLCVVVITGSLDLHEISNQQSGNGIMDWNLFKHPILLFVFILFQIGAMAESNRTPFDLAESESELVGGYHTEYSGFRWGIFMLAEYGMMLLFALLGTVLFFGSWNSPLPNFSFFHAYDLTMSPIWNVFWLLSKTFVIVLIQMWIRWSMPRFRIDQLMSLAWGKLIPSSFVLLLLCILWTLFVR